MLLVVAVVTMNWYLTWWVLINTVCVRDMSLWQQIGVVKETRPYTTWLIDKTGNGVHSNSGIVAAKAELNRLHQKLAKDGYTQVHIYVEQT